MYTIIRAGAKKQLAQLFFSPIHIFFIRAFHFTPLQFAQFCVSSFTSMFLKMWSAVTTNFWLEAFFFSLLQIRTLNFFSPMSMVASITHDDATCFLQIKK